MSGPNTYASQKLVTQGSMDTLPIEVELKAAPSRGAVSLIIAGLMIFFAYKGINAVPTDILGPYGSTPRLLVRIAVAAGALFIVGRLLLAFLFSSARYTVDGTSVTARERSITGSTNWSEPLANYESVRWRRVKVRERSGSSSGQYRTRYRQIIELVHPDGNKTVPLFVQMSRKPGMGVAMEAIKMAREANSASPDERRDMEAEIARLGDMTNAGDPRERLEALANLLGLPAIARE